MKIFSGIAQLKVEPYDEDQGTGELRYVQVINVVEFQMSVSRLMINLIMGRCF